MADSTFLIPAKWLLIVVIIRCMLLLWRIWKAKTVAPLLLLLPRLYYLGLYGWIDLTNPPVEVGRIFSRWGVLVLFSTEVLSDIIYWGVKRYGNRS